MYTEEHGIDVCVYGEKNIREDEEYVKFMTKYVADKEKVLVVNKRKNSTLYTKTTTFSVALSESPRKNTLRCIECG
ncbi:MAG: hypothetical protein QXP97_01150 [Desulfurococcus sp.]|jgi:hypothetical protein|uniref:hypothetical protein n=1 Tax=Desulfurococcus sp. TaxID=51678 RepID=UPI00315F142A